MATELHTWAAEPVSVTGLVARLETYEQTKLGSDAQRLAVDCRWLAASDQTGDRKLAGEVESYYRNANLRLAVSGSLINCLLPQPAATQMPVAETIIGVPVHGYSTTWTHLNVRLVPDPNRIRLGFEAKGVVASDTTSSSGPATFHNAGTSNFLVRKLYVVGPNGLRNWPAVAEAHSASNSLISMETSFDGIPLFGALVRNIAHSQFQDSQSQAVNEAENKLANRARLQLDSEMNCRMAIAQAEMTKRLIKPIARLGVDVTPVAFTTTDQRVAVRLRVANEEQIGSHTPRPRAPSDSLASAQLHQSAANNTLERLDLAGQKFALPELFLWLSTKAGKPTTELPPDLPDDVVVTFSQNNPVRIELQNDHLELCLQVAELRQGNNRWRDFSARAIYKPEATGLQASFVREGSIRLEGDSVRGKPELLLRSIFSKALAPTRHMSLVPEKFAQDPRLKDLALTQFVIQDGWLGLAWAPRTIDLQTQKPASKKR